MAEKNLAKVKHVVINLCAFLAYMKTYIFGLKPRRETFKTYKLLITGAFAFVGTCFLCKIKFNLWVSRANSHRSSSLVDLHLLT